MWNAATISAVATGAVSVLAAVTALVRVLMHEGGPQHQDPKGGQ